MKRSHLVVGHWAGLTIVVLALLLGLSIATPPLLAVRTLDERSTFGRRPTFGGVAITVMPPLGPPGTSAQVRGGNFSPGSSVSLYWDAVQDISLSSAIVGEDGTFNAVVVIPEQAEPGGHSVIAVGEGDPDAGRTQANFLIPRISLLDSPEAFGSDVTVIGFDDLPAGTHVEHQYADLGIHFVDDETTTPVIVYEGSATSSYPNALFSDADPPHTNAGIPLTIDFDEPKTRVGLYMGNGTPRDDEVPNSVWSVIGVLSAFTREGHLDWTGVEPGASSGGRLPGPGFRHQHLPRDAGLWGGNPG